VLTLDFLCVLLPHLMLLNIDMPLVAPAVGVIRVMPKGSSSSCSLKKTESFRRPNTYAHTCPVW